MYSGAYGMVKQDNAKHNHAYVKYNQIAGQIGSRRTTLNSKAEGIRINSKRNCLP